MEFPIDLVKRIKEAKIISVLVIDDINDTLSLAKALLDGGITAIELALRTPASLKALELIKTNYPEFICGVGTVLTTEQVVAISPYADFIVTPGCNREVITEANRMNIPIAPGISTPSDVETAVSLGCRILKFFPAEALGGLNYLNAMAAPYAHLNLKYIPLGGINEKNCFEYANHPKVLAVGGSWIATPKLILNKNFGQITENAHIAMQLCRGERNEK